MILEKSGQQVKKRKSNLNKTKEKVELQYLETPKETQKVSMSEKFQVKKNTDSGR